MNLTLTATISIFVLFAQERLGLDPVGYGVLMTSVAVGGVVGSFAAEYLVGWLGAGTVMRVGLLIEAAITGVIALSREPLLVGAMLDLFGFHAIVLERRYHFAPAADYPGAPARAGEQRLPAAGPRRNVCWSPHRRRPRPRFGLSAPFWFASLSMVVLAAVVWSILSNETVDAARRDATPSG